MKKRTSLFKSGERKIDPDAIIFAGLLVAAIGALGALLDGVSHVRDRLDNLGAARKATRRKVAKWGGLVKSLSAQLDAIEKFVQRTRIQKNVPDEGGIPIVGGRLELTDSDVLQLRDMLKRLSKLTQDAAATSIDLAQELTGEGARRSAFAGRRLQEMGNDFLKTSQEHSASLREMWGANEFERLAGEARRALDTLSRFESRLAEYVADPVF